MQSYFLFPSTFILLLSIRGWTQFCKLQDLVNHGHPRIYSLIYFGKTVRILSKLIPVCSECFSVTAEFAHFCSQVDRVFASATNEPSVTNWSNLIQDCASNRITESDM